MNDVRGGDGSPSVSAELAAIERTLRMIAVGALLILAVWLLSDALLLGFAAVLIACVLHGMAGALHRQMHLSQGWSLVVVIVTLITLFAALIWLRGPEMLDQAQQLIHQLVTQVEQLWTQIRNGAWGGGIAEAVRHTAQSAANGLPGYATGLVTSTLGIGGSLLVIFVTALCLVASPHVYMAGFLRLLPLSWRPRGLEVLRRLGHTLQLWFLGQFVDMVVVTLLVGAGLFALGVPLAGMLALFAGLLNFVPYVGALVGAVPAVLIALAVSPTLALWVALLFLTVQMIEGNLIAPFVQKHAGTLPPALTIASQTILGTLFGLMGLVLATPMMAAAIVAIRLIYVESVLERDAQSTSRTCDGSVGTRRDSD